MFAPGAPGAWPAAGRHVWRRAAWPGATSALAAVPGLRPRRLRCPGRVRAGYIRSGTGIPSRPSPVVRIRSTRAQSASLLSRNSSDGAFSTGHVS